MLFLMAMHGVVCVSILTSHTRAVSHEARRREAAPRDSPDADRARTRTGERETRGRPGTQAAIMAEVKLKEPSRAGDAAPPRQVDSRGAEV